MKRERRETKYITKDNVDDDVEDDEDQHKPSGFAKATPKTLSRRRMLKASASHRFDKKMLYGKQVKALNDSFLTYFRDQVSKDPAACLVDAAQDCVDYLTKLSDRYLRSYGEVFTFGNGDCGQLAHGIENDDDMAVPFPRSILSLRDKKVCMVACGGLHNAAITEDGLVYTWGCNDDGSLGRDGEETFPMLVDTMAQKGVPVVSVGCGDGQTMAVTAEGEVYGWGCYKDKEGKKWFNPSPSISKNDMKALLKDINQQKNFPILIQGVSGAVEIACGSAFNLALCADGSVYSWGLGECGELGREAPPLKPEEGVKQDKEAIFRVHITPGPMYVMQAVYRAHGAKATLTDAPISNVKAIGCGSFHSLVVAGGGEGLGGLYACGLNNYGQLGIGNDPTDPDRPKPDQFHLCKTLLDSFMKSGKASLLEN